MVTENSTQKFEQPGNDVANWLQDWTFDPDAFGSLWEHFFPKLVGVAEKNMRRLPSKARDGEDVALSAFKDVYLGCADGRFDIQNRDQMWQLLLKVTSRKVLQERRSQFSQKRGGAFQHFGNGDGRLEQDSLATIIDQNPMPETVEDVYNQCRELINSLPEEIWRRTAEMKLEGCSNDEISDLLGCSIDTTKRHLQKIRELWQKHLPPDAS